MRMRLYCLLKRIGGLNLKKTLMEKKQDTRKNRIECIPYVARKTEQIHYMQNSFFSVLLARNAFAAFFLYSADSADL